MDEPRFVGDWTLVCELGAGAFGKVCLWRNKINYEQIAVKKCKFRIPEKLTDNQRRRWINEVEIMRTMNNKNIVHYKELPPILAQALDQDNPTGLPILSMEYCSKGNLRKFLLQPSNLKGCAEDDVRCILEDLTNAISYLHGRNITHRDIKPENIVIQMCNIRPSKNIYKLIDLGYAKELETIASFVGTLPYLAPEILKNDPYTMTVDYWSLGILAYEIVTGVLPFLPSKTPVERYNYLRQKTDDHISISMSKDGVPRYSSEILLDNRLCLTFRTGMEEWLRLLLVFDSNRRGFRNGVKKNVFQELQVLLNKKMLKVFSVYNYRHFDYEITPSTTLADVKSFIERDSGIKTDSQVFAMDMGSILGNDDTLMISFFHQENMVRTLYVFKKNDSFEQRTVIIPQQVQLLFLHSEMNSELLKLLCGRAMLFIREEKESMEVFDTALMTQAQQTATLVRNMAKRYSEIRCNLALLLREISCYEDCGEWLNLPEFQRNEAYLNCVMERRRCLRQAKELVECCNALTENYLKILAMPDVERQHEDIRKCCLPNETSMAKHYDDAMKLYQQASATSTTDITDILSEVLRIPSKGIFSNQTLKTNLRCSLRVQRRLQKLWISCCAIGDAIDVVSNSLRNCEKAKYECTRSIYANRTNERPQLHFPIDRETDGIPTEELLTENLSIRYQFQEESGKFENILRNVQRDMTTWDFIVKSAKQNC